MPYASQDIYFIVTGQQNESRLPECFDSLLSQTSSRWRCIYTDDASTDKSLAIAHTYKERWPKHFAVLTSPTRRYKTIHFFRACQLVPPSAIVAELDADDRLIDRDVVKDLSFLHMFFDMVWTQHVTTNLTKKKWDIWRSTPLPPHWSRNNGSGTDVWSKQYFPGHMRTFKRFLFDYIDFETFIFRNKIIKAAFDMVYYTTLLELVPDDFICFYDKTSYEYRILPHNEEFVEYALRSSVRAQDVPQRLQTAVDRWFKRKPALTKMNYAKELKKVDNMDAAVCFRGKEIPQHIREHDYCFSLRQLKRLDQVLPRIHPASDSLWWDRKLSLDV